jgi:hypothetical protein
MHGIVRAFVRALVCTRSESPNTRTAEAHERSAAVQQKPISMRYTETVIGTCRKQTWMSEKAKNASEFVN